MKRVLFENRHGLRKEIAVVETLPEAYKEIHQYCHDRNYYIYQMTSTKEKDAIRVEIGSFFETFFIKELKQKEEDDINKINNWVKGAFEVLKEYNINAKDERGNLKDFSLLVTELAKEVSCLEIIEVKSGQKTVGYVTNKAEALKIIENYLSKEEGVEIYRIDQRLNYIDVNYVHNNMKHFHSFFLSKHKLNKSL